MMPPKLCEHCTALTEDLRAVGSVIGAQSIHYAMAAVIEAQREGHSTRELVEVVRLLSESGELQRGGPVTDDVAASASVVSSVPRAAVVAQVIEMGRGERNV